MAGPAWFSWACGCALVLSGAVVTADDPTHLTAEHVDTLHKEFDFDKDGKLSLEELHQAATDMRKRTAVREMKGAMPQFDTDGDGRVSRTEFYEMVKPGPDSEDALTQEYVDKLWEASDKNADGILEPEELTRLYHTESDESLMAMAGDSVLKSIDTDGDGTVSRKEFVEDGGDTDANFDELDKNNDDKLESSELVHMATERFSHEQEMRELIKIADSNLDDHISFEELMAARVNLHEESAGHLLHQWAGHFGGEL
uniref:EF-hand domain-containing protein n=1 Tax=Alexandrium catenella TaxID=2925 RepID=A0A7S1RUB9_ALECA